MKKILMLVAVISTFCAASINASNFSWSVSVGIGNCIPVYTPPVVCVPSVVYVQPTIVRHVVHTQPVVGHVVHTTPVIVQQPICTVPVVNYYSSDCYRSPVSGVVWVGNGPRYHSKRR